MAQCKFGCGREVASGVQPRNGRPWTTCCWPCAVHGAKIHSAACDKKAGQTHVVLLRILEAKLESSSDFDPQVTVHWNIKESGRRHIATTPVAWSCQGKPVWNYTCIGQPLPHCVDMASCIVVDFGIQDHDTGNRGGLARIRLSDLLYKGGRRGHCGDRCEGSPSCFAECETSTLNLKLNGTVQGTISVQGVIVPREIKDIGSACVGDLTEVNPEYFEHPVEKMPVSGGTAALYGLRIQSPGAQSATYYIGKDLSHAQDEVLFYESVLRLRESSPKTVGFDLLAGFLFEYKGIFTAREKNSDKDDPAVNLIVLRNLFDNSCKLRMLDIKIGEKTAVAGWHGKSHARAYYRLVLDHFTNSASEGFRLAGFNGAPSSLTSRDPLLDFGGGSPKRIKQAWRIVFSKMPGSEMIGHFLNLAEESKVQTNMAQTLSAVEVAEIVAHEIAVQLVRLAAACRKVQVPQKWVGSSVGLTFDSGFFPPRSGGEKAVRSKTQVNIFDWGRSEINTVSGHKKLSEEEQHDRTKFWQYYVGGVDRLSWECARAYWHLFSNSQGWGKTVDILILDFDSSREDDKLGYVRVPLVTTSTPVTLAVSNSGNDKATLTFSVTEIRMPASSRMKACWRIHVHKANHLRIADILRRSSDTYFVVKAVSPNGLHTFTQQSAVKVGCLDPEWDEAFDLPIACSTWQLSSALQESDTLSSTSKSGNNCPANFPEKFPAVGSSAVDDDASVLEWVELLDAHSGSSAGLHRVRRDSSQLAKWADTGATILEGVFRPLGFGKPM